MGIITQTPGSKADWNGLDAVELVRTKAEQADSETSPPREIKNVQTRLPTIVSGSRSLTLSDRCVIYRNVVSRQKIVTIVPLRSIESFAVQTFKPKWPLLFALLVVLASILTGLGLFLIFGKGIIGVLAHFWAANRRLVWIPSIPLFLGLAALVLFAFRSQTELVIYSRSGTNQVRLPLSGKLKDAVEQFVTAIESQMGES